MCATLPPARLADKAVAIPSGEVQFVATEFGSVNLIGKNLHERATAIIGLAHPDFREELWQHAKSEGILAHEHAFTKALSGIYPSHLEEIKEIDGTQVFFRPARPSDERLMQEHFYSMDKEDIIARFMYDKPLFPKRDVSCMCRLDYDRNMAVLALAGEIGFEKVVGIGVSFYQPATNTAEVAFSVLRQWQGKRIASVIIRKLIPEAIKRGTDGFMAYTLPNNRRMIRLFEALPYKVKKFTQEGILVLSCSFRNMA